jgi:hypothetical protein
MGDLGGGFQVFIWPFLTPQPPGSGGLKRINQVPQMGDLGGGYQAFIWPFLTPQPPESGGFKKHPP